jgi:hypothetical protein
MKALLSVRASENSVDLGKGTGSTVPLQAVPIIGSALATEVRLLFPE